MIAKLASDPSIMALMQNPKVMAAFADIQSNPANVAKYASDPDISTSRCGSGCGGVFFAWNAYAACEGAWWETRARALIGPWRARSPVMCTCAPLQWKSFPSSRLRWAREAHATGVQAR